MPPERWLRTILCALDDRTDVGGILWYYCTGVTLPRKFALISALAAFCYPLRASTQSLTAPDSSLLVEINAIRAIDAHAHPQPFLPPGEKDELDPPGSIPPLGAPALLRITNPAWPKAWLALWNYPARSDSADPHRALSLKMAERARLGRAYPAWVLDKLNIETMLDNRHSTGPGLDAPRFRLVWLADPLVFPLDNRRAKASNPQLEELYDVEERWLATYLREQHLEAIPPTLDEYLTRFVIPEIASRKREGAVSLKLAIAYLRDLRVGDPSRVDAARLYGLYARGGTPSDSEYRIVQDYLIRAILTEAGRLGLPVQIHVGAGSGPFFDNTGSDPFLLMPLILDPALRRTTFVLVHGGFPNAAATRVLFAKPNVFVDFSSQAFLSTTRELSQVLRAWLEFRPEKVMFGTDAYPVSSLIGWEELAWMTNASSRRALAIALTGMIDDGEITRADASRIARMVMRETALSVYGLAR